MSEGRLVGKVALIVGGAGAMGSAQARLFASEGAAVVVGDMRAREAETVASEISVLGHMALSVELDVSEATQWAAAVAVAESEYGGLDILCYSAGANFRVDFEDQTEDMWHTVMDANLTGAFIGTQAVVPAMRKIGGGSLIYVGSIGSVRPGAGSPAYGASKMGIVGLARSAASSFARDNIRANVVCPGHVDTPFLRADSPHSPNDWSTSIDNEENYNARLRDTPMGRLMTPEDIAWTYLFLASDESAMITGVSLPVDGGALL